MMANPVQTAPAGNSPIPEYPGATNCSPSFCRADCAARCDDSSPSSRSDGSAQLNTPGDAAVADDSKRSASPSAGCRDSATHLDGVPFVVAAFCTFIAPLMAVIAMVWVLAAPFGELTALLMGLALAAVGLLPVSYMLRHPLTEEEA